MDCRQKCCCFLMFLAALIFLAGLAGGLFLLMHPSCNRFPNLAPYTLYFLLYWGSVGYLFWTAIWALIFLLMALCVKRGRKWMGYTSIFWVIVHLAIGITLTVLWIRLPSDPNLDDVNLQTLTGSTPESQPWLIYAQNTEICCGVANSTDVTPQFVQTNCDPLFHPLSLMIGCAPLIRRYLAGCRFLPLLFVIIATTLGLLPWLLCCRTMSDRTDNTVYPDSRKSSKTDDDGDEDDRQSLSRDQPESGETSFDTENQSGNTDNNQESSNYQGSSNHQGSSNYQASGNYQGNNQGTNNHQDNYQGAQGTYPPYCYPYTPAFNYYDAYRWCYPWHLDFFC